MEQFICLAGLGEQGFSAKSFRPTGATSAIEQRVNPEVIRKVGRWKNSEVFFFPHIMCMLEPQIVFSTIY